MSKKYTIDGRDPNARGYVKENRMANQQETDALVRVLEGWGLEVEDFKFHLFGRLDDVHGWYLFGISREDSNREDFVVLGDCLDALEAPYDKVLDLDEVMQFARTTGSGENVGTAYDAMQTWGVFTSLSQGFCDMMDSIDVCIENERAYWEARYNEWMLAYDVMFDTDMGGNEKVTIRIPAQMESNDAADMAFMSAWKDECATYKVGEAEQAYVDSFDCDRGDARNWAESKKRAMDGICHAVADYLHEGITPDEDDALAESRERVEGEKVWVLTIYKDDQFFPVVHRTLEGAVESAINDMEEGMEDEEDYDFAAIRRELQEQMYWDDEVSGAVYDIAVCRVFE